MNTLAVSDSLPASENAKRTFVIMLGSVPPVIEVVADPAGDPPGQAWYSVVFSDAPPPDELPDDYGDLVHVDCLLDEHPEVGRGMDLAREHGGSWCFEAGEWFSLEAWRAAHDQPTG